MVSNLTVKVGADIAGLQKELQKATGHLQGFGKGMKAVGGMMAGVFAAGKIIDFGKEVFNVTAEFQKFEAVLTNTLGNNSAAKAALAQITEFATKTPFQVNELTGSFVKLANQGFVPTLNEMKSLGDLASAMGKSFDQLTEAIIDAQTGEFERLKEFGIRASKQGDKVTFTFKGVKKQVDFTADSIREYVLSLGQVEGVAGGMEAQSKTLGGGLSNLQDSFEQLQLAIGKSAESGGLFSKMLDMVAGSVKGLTELFRENTIQEYLDAAKFFAEAKRQAAEAGDMDAWKRANDALQEAVIKIREYKKGQEELKRKQDETTSSTQKQTDSVRDLIAEWNKAHSIFNTKKFNPVDQIKSKDGGSFLLDTGVFAEQASRFAAIGERIKNTNIEIGGSFVAVREEARKTGEIFEKDLIPIFNSGLSGIGQALGNAMNGTASFGDSLLKVFGGVLTQFGELLITVGIGIESFKKSLTTLNPYLAIGAGVALVALGTAVSGSIKSLGSSASSGGSSRPASTGSGRSNVGSLGANGLEIQVGGEFRIQGPDLVYIFNRQQQLNNRTRG